jgi:hypothetical protein
MRINTTWKTIRKQATLIYQLKKYFKEEKWLDIVFGFALGVGFMLLFLKVQIYW